MNVNLTTNRLYLAYVPDVETLDWIGSGRCGVYYITCDSEAAGAVSLTSVSRGHGEIGYEIEPKFHNQGIATEAVEVVIAYVARHHGFTLLTAQARIDNVASVRVLEKNGFVRTGAKLCWPDDGGPTTVARYRRLTGLGWDETAGFQSVSP